MTRRKTGALVSEMTTSFKLRDRDHTYDVELGMWCGQIYTGVTHNEMVAALRAHGVIGDLDAKIQAFANVESHEARRVLERAKKLRGEIT